MPDTPSLTILYTGGTISMLKSGSKGSSVPALTGEDLSRSVPGLDKTFHLHNVDFGQLPGPHMTPERMLSLAQAVRDALDSGSDGVVITHGTDTLEETAYMLDLLHHDERPVVFVGAMRTRDELSWDGPVNLSAACLVAGHKDSIGRGVMVVMNNTIHSAKGVSKTYTNALDTFMSPVVGPLGIVDVGQVEFFREAANRMVLDGVVTPTSLLSTPLPRVELLTAYAGADGTLTEAAVNVGAQGIVVQAMGRGNVPPEMAEPLMEAMRKGVKVVLCSRCWGGRVAPIYGYPGGGATLFEGGAIIAPRLNSLKARLGLKLALAAGYDDQRLREFFLEQ